MPQHWLKGEAEVERALAARDVERVPANRDHAAELLAQAGRHLDGVRAIAQLDPIGAYQLAYDAARKALTSVLAVQGLRPTSQGGHVIVGDLARAQFDPPLGQVVRPFGRLRRRRHQSEYPDESTDPVDADEVADALVEVQAMVELADEMLDRLAPF